MSRSREGHTNAGRIETSFKRLLPILEILKRAPHPLSAQDIAKHAYSGSDDVMLNVSTNIGEMRSRENRDMGYVVPKAHRWVIKKKVGQDYAEIDVDENAAQDNHKPGKFLVDPELALLWHDGRPRYWLIAAPGWEPIWTISEEGLLVPARGRCVPAEAGDKSHIDDVAQPGRCGNPACRQLLMDPLGPPYCPDDVCKRGYFASLQVRMF
jgi:hypothetical protein